MNYGFKERAVSKRKYKNGIYYQLNIPKEWGDKYIDKKKKLRYFIKGSDLILRPLKTITENQTKINGEFP